MAVKYKEYKPEEHTWSNEVNTAQKQAEYYNNQQLQNFTYDDFKDSQQTTDFLNQYNNMGQAPTWDKNNNTWWNKLTDTMNAIENLQPFSYDVNGDALYQQYKDQYVNQGKMAMMDTMGQAAAMTGGYGNSYAQSVGQQAYQGYLQQLTDKVPELYQLAYDKYNREGDELYNRLSSYGSLYNTEYGEHRDAVSDHQYQKSHLADMWSKSHAVDMDTYTANRDTYAAEVDSYNSNLISNRTHYNDVYNTLKQTEWGMHMDNETLKKVAIEVANENLYRNEQSRIADAELDYKNSQLDFKALEEKYEGYISPEEQANLKKAENSASTKTLKASVLTKTELARRGYQTTIGGKTKRFDNYTQYIDAVLENNYKEGKLTEHEVAYLKGYYGIE